MQVFHLDRCGSSRLIGKPWAPNPPLVVRLLSYVATIMWGVLLFCFHAFRPARTGRFNFRVCHRPGHVKRGESETATVHPSVVGDECATRAKTSPPQTPLRDSRCSRHVLLFPRGRALLCP
ncbi:hypothetical protein MTP99_010197 [Tenebrio molitor]|nr:hypothetical protein MTP99_010197 [Tenebrio molitor]